MVRIALLCCAAALAGCVEPSTPSPAAAKLQAACDAGDLAACQSVLAAETERSRIAASAPPIYRAHQTDPNAFRTAPVQHRPMCYSGLNGYMVCQ